MPGEASRNMPAAELDDGEREAIRAAGAGYPLVDARCRHHRCTEKNVYRMVGHCTNCGAKPLLVLISAGHSVPTGEACPKCGCYDVRCDRLATDDELPSS